MRNFEFTTFVLLLTRFFFLKTESDVKSVEKPRREYGDSQTKKSVKSRNSSNSRKSTRTGVVSSGRSKNAEVPARGLGKPKKNYDSKNFSDRKESKVDIPVPLFKGKKFDRMEDVSQF